MAYVKTNGTMIGKRVMLTEQKSSLAGFFEPGSVVTITEIDDLRGYTFTDEQGNMICEAGWDGFKEV